MNINELIASGNLELYVCGALSQEEAMRIDKAIEAHPEIKAEVERIEAMLQTLAEGAAPTLSPTTWSGIEGQTSGVRSITKASKRTNWGAISGWAAAILLLGGIFMLLRQNNTLTEDLEITTNENIELNEQVISSQDQLAETNALLDILRGKEFNAYTLPGNDAVAPEAFAKVFYNAQEGVAYIDIKGLPEAPDGKVYQAWSLTLNPLTPSSMGIMETAAQVEEGIYKFENVPAPEAFGITLEPAGGSASPTLEQLYTLGTVTP